MTNEELLEIAERNLKKAQNAYDIGICRKGVTEEEITNLRNKLEYAVVVHYMIKERKEYDDYIREEESFERAYGTWRDDYELEE